MPDPYSALLAYPDASVKESRERVSAALHNMGYPLVDKKVVVNLSPTEQKKNGPLATPEVKSK